MTNANPSVRVVPLDTYTFDPNNANSGTDEGRALVADSLDLVGAGRSIVVAADNTAMAGNKTLQAARDAGLNAIEVETDGDYLVIVKRRDWADASDPDARQYAYFDNRASEKGLQWNPEQILADLRAGMKLDKIFDKETLATLAHRGRRRLQTANPKPDEVTNFAVEWGTKPGQTWRLGEHRLLITDCTSESDVVGLFGDRVANLLVTSPPYWVGKPYETQKSEDEIAAFIDACASTWTKVVSPKYGRIIINTGTCSIHSVEKGRPVEVLPLIDWWTSAFREDGWLLRHMRLWVKSSEMAAASVSPRTDAISSGGAEYILDFHTNDFEQMLVFWEPDAEQRGQLSVREPWAQQQVWTDIQGEKSAGGHVAAFPIELPSRYIRMYSKADELVFDPFGGSGTTMLACQALGRVCYSTEISPEYAAMSLHRFREETGIQPTLLNDDE